MKLMVNKRLMHQNRLFWQRKRLNPAGRAASCETVSGFSKEAIRLGWRMAG